MGKIQTKIPLEFILLFGFLLIPGCEYLIGSSFYFTSAVRPILVFAILGLGLNVVTGFTGLLNLGVAAFMAIGAYAYAISTCDIYPFQVGFWFGILISILAGSVTGIALGLPTLRLTGDYLAVVTMAFGEIVQDLLRNLEGITKGTQGINPLPGPTAFGISFSPQNPIPWYLLYWLILVLAVIFNRNLLYSKIGRSWRAIREDQLAAGCMGVRVVKSKLIAFATGAALCSLAGALWVASLGSTGEPGNYDFQVSVIALCIVIVGGMASIPGVLIGAILMVGFNSIVLTWLTTLFTNNSGSGSVFSMPNNWKYIVFGLALVLMMRYRPNGLVSRKNEI